MTIITRNLTIFLLSTTLTSSNDSPWDEDFEEWEDLADCDLDSAGNYEPDGDPSVFEGSSTGKGISRTSSNGTLHGHWCHETSIEALVSDGPGSKKRGRSKGPCREKNRSCPLSRNHRAEWPTWGLKVSPL